MAKKNVSGLKVDSKNYYYESNAITENGITNEVVKVMSPNPPDLSGEWVDDGWGNWTRNRTFAVGGANYKKIPIGLFDDGWGNLTPVLPNQSLDTDTVDNVRNSIRQAKKNQDTAVGKVLNTILFKGTDFINLLISLNIIKNPTLEISYGNLNFETLRDKYQKGYLNQPIVLKEKTLSTNDSSNNLTFLGIDFTKPQTWLVILLFVTVAITINRNRQANY